MVSLRTLAFAGVVTLLTAFSSGAPVAAQAAEADQASGPVGQWVNVTPAGVDTTCDFGTSTVLADPARPAVLYTSFGCGGVWKSTDYGQTWHGPVNTGANGASGSIAAIAPSSSGQPPILYGAGIRGPGLGFWKSTDDGVSWSNYKVGPAGDRQDVYPPAVDPYDGNHLVMTGHEQNLIVQSTDGGQTWTSVPMNPGMHQEGGTGIIAFVNMGDSQRTRNTWLWFAQGSGGKIGTWRTTDAGASWVKVDSNEHQHGDGQLYQPDTSGVVYMAGVYSGNGWGVLRSEDYGQTWTHVGNTGGEAIVYGTPKNVYSESGWACSVCNVAPNLQTAPQPGASGWADSPTPGSMAEGPAMAAVVFDGTHYVIVTANWTSGLWRYVEG